MITVDIAIEHGAWHAPAARPIIEEAVGMTLATCAMADIETELSVLLTDDMRIAEVNGQWRNKPKATNVLSFPAAQMRPGQKPGPLLGDIVLAHETISDEAMAMNRTFDAHLFHLVVHGTLHCLGHDHVTENEAQAMESLEIAILGDKGLPDPYLISEE